MTDWYAGAREHKFHPEFVEAGIVSQEQADEASRRWVNGVKRMHTLVKEMPDEAKDRVKRKPRVWAKIGGLNVLSGHTPTKELFDSIEFWIDRIARRNADIRREEAGFTLNDRGWHLVDPQGRTSPPHNNGQKYGPYSTPESQFPDLGPFDGTITDETKFTK